MSFIGESTLLEFFKKLRINPVSLFAFVYSFFVVLFLIDLTNSTGVFKNLYNEILNSTLINILGIISLAHLGWQTFKTKKSRKKSWHKLGFIFRNLFGQSHENIELEDDWQQKLSESEIQNKLVEYSVDAREIKIFAGDADFLFSTSGERSIQFNEIKEMGKRCKLLISDSVDVEPQYLKELIDSGVKIKKYPKERQNVGLRGRIKICDDGTSAMLFSKKKNSYLTQNIKNTYLIQMLSSEYDDVFNHGKNPLIKYILFDLAGVYAEGDFQNFLNEVNAILDTDIQNKSSNYLCVDERLNLGTDNYTIINYIEEQTELTLSDTQKKEIRYKWNNTWTVNPHVKEIAKKLHESEYQVAICSNCDEDNGDIYLTKDIINGFDKFFSYEIKILKPNREYFEYVLQSYKCKPFECLFIDDHEENIKVAKEMGLNTIKVARTHSIEEKAEKLRREFNGLSINYE